MEEKKEVKTENKTENQEQVEEKVSTQNQKEEVKEEIKEVEEEHIQQDDFSEEHKTENLHVIEREKKKKKKKSWFKKKKPEEPIEEKKIVRHRVNVKQGLTNKQVEERKKDGLVNVVDSKNTKTYKSIILGNIFTFFNMLSFAVAIALMCVGQWGDCFFLLIVFANMLIGIIQEVKAKKTIEKISLVSSPTALVIREKEEKEIPVDEIVLDDVIMFQTGKQIAADSIVLEGSVEVNESLLTGESVAIKKVKGDILYSGSFVVGGKCYAKVDKIGNDTYTAKLAAQAKQYQKPKSELMGTLNLIIKVIGIVIIPLSIMTFINNFDKMAITETIKKTAGSLIGMIPSGMFLLTSMALAVGVIKLASKRTLVQDLYSIEMLARVDVLCLDKTGTLTDGTMKVAECIELEKNEKLPLKTLVGSMLGALEDNNPTSRALMNYFGYNKELTPDYVMPFNSTRKMSGVTFLNGESYIFGAPEYVLKTKNVEIEKMVKDYASKGFRVILFAKVDGDLKGDKVPLKRTPIAIVVIEDHIREDAPQTIKWFKENGVEIKIISGDNPVTVSEVSKRVGVDNADKYISLEGLNEQQVIEAVSKYTIFGRVSPEQKCILVKAIKSQGKKVAMTGDGVNDILALKEADCSVAMASGSEATRLVSNLVLLDSNFSSMPSVVAEGRRVVNNVQKSSSLFLMKTMYTIFLTIFCLISKQDYPFSTTQVMLMETLVIGIPSFFLALQANNEKIQGKFLSNVLAKSLPAALILFLSFVACFVFDKIIPVQGQFATMAALCLTFTGLIILFKLCRPFDIFRAIMFSCMVILCFSALSLSWMQTFFDYVQLDLQNLLFVICVVQATYPLYSGMLKILDKIMIRKKVKANEKK